VTGSAAAGAPVVDGLFTWPSEEPRLIAGRCATCAAVFFPRFHEQHRPECEARAVEEIRLSRRGRLVSFTTIHVPPPPIFPLPAAEVPYSVGLVELSEGLVVAGLVSRRAPGELRRDLEVEIVVEALYHEPDGTPRVTWKLRPTGERGETR
jgi:uncharacterized OB-fold protein